MSGSELQRLVGVMDRLRSPGGCPWDAEQTHESLVKYLLEESYEFIDSVDAKDREGMREELGDVLLQVYFHSRIAEDHPTDPFSIEDVARSIADKLIRRHPHVFDGLQVSGTEENVGAALASIIAWARDNEIYPENALRLYGRQIAAQIKDAESR